MSRVIDALVFGPGLPPQGVRGTISVEPNALRLVQGETNVRLPYQEIEVTAGGFDHQQMMLSWQNGAERWTAMPADAEAREGLLASAPPALREKLGPWQRRVGRTRAGFRLGWAVVVLIVLFPVFILGAFLWQSDRLAGWAAGHVSLETEQKLGDMAFEQMRPSLKLLGDGPAVRAVTEMGKKLTAGSKYRYQWFVTDDPTVNAFAMPGGYVVVHTGLLKAADSAEEVAGVLAHEVQHVELRHSLKGMIHGLGLQAVWSIALGDIGSGVFAGLAQQLSQLKFGRDQETQADTEGLKTLRRAGIAPEGMLTFFQKLSKHDHGSVEMLSSHPLSETRFEQLRAVIAADGKWASQPLPYDWQAIKASLPQRPARQ